MSIILKYYYIFEQLIKNNLVNKIFVSINYKLLKSLRNDSNIDYYKNYIIYFKHINTYDRIIIEDNYNDSYKSITPTSLSNMFKIPIKFKIYDKLIYKKSIYTFDYITISTKILGIDYELYQKYKNILFDKLNTIGCKVILLGERNISNCNEYQIHKTYTIYDDLIKNINNYIDNTINNNNNNNDLKSFMKSATILNKSKLNIYISNGGISEMMGYVSINILGLTTNQICLDKISYVNDCNNIKIFNKFENFLQNIKID